MNRIILIGNGFDKAHGLLTGYTDFMNSYWKEFAAGFHKRGAFKSYEDKFVTFEVPYQDIPFSQNINSYDDLKKYINRYPQIKLEFKNKFFGYISERTCLNNWLDIENVYYALLKGFLKPSHRYVSWASVKELNDEFCQVKTLLEKYLSEVCKQKITKIKSIDEAFMRGIEAADVALSKQQMFLDSMPEFIERISNHLRETNPDYSFARISDEDLKADIEYKIKENGIFPYTTIFLNFNYTNTAEKLYMSPENEGVINIHGELNSESNPIIFGYGDELDDDYSEIEKTQNGDFMDNMKHIHYSNTERYRELLLVLQKAPYQVLMMGHSCGNSDRTLLQTIFEHSNCISIKPFYYQWKDKDTGLIRDNYTDTVKNISRNFNDKKAMRDIVVNKKYCTPLVPYSDTIVSEK